MQRFMSILGAVVLGLFILTPVAVAADSPGNQQSVLVAVNHDVTIPVGEHADVVVVVNGTATISGDVGTVVMVNGKAAFSAATAGTVVAVNSQIDLGSGTVVSGDVRTVGSTVEQASTAIVQGETRDVTLELIGLGVFLGPAILLLAVGFALAAIAAALFLAAVGARQVRSAEALISTEPGLVLATGLGGMILTPIAAVLAIVTIVGAPLGLGVLLGLWPLMMFLGYLIAGVWIGDWLLHLTSPEKVRERPYLASVVGLLLLQIISFVPFAGAIASMFGFGAVILLTWRAFRHHEPGPAAARQAPLPAGV